MAKRPYINHAVFPDIPLDDFRVYSVNVRPQLKLRSAVSVWYDMMLDMMLSILENPLLSLFSLNSFLVH